jgi:hypothetical protein
MKVGIRLVGGKYIRKLYFATSAVFENLDAGVFTRSLVLQCSRCRLRTFSSATATGKTTLQKPPWRVMFFGTDDFSLSSLKMLYREL